VLTGEKCVVRAWRTSDVPDLLLHANDIEVARQLRDRFPHPYTRAHADAFLRHVLSNATSDAPSNLAIIVDGRAAGDIGFVRGTDVERFSAEIGYWLGQQYWGRGIVTEALTLVTEYAFQKQNLLRLFALPFANNAGSIRVLEKAGYEREGLLRRSSVKFGEPRDQLLYSRINDSWTFER
jgi:RimJ/RimL family protein N-acetyltransferase